MPSLANRYLRALLSRPQGPRPRAGYSFWQRYWASLTGKALPPRPAQPAPTRPQVSPTPARERRTIFSRFSASIPAVQGSWSNRWKVLVATATAAAAAAAAATGLAVGVFSSGGTLPVAGAPAPISSAASPSPGSPVTLEPSLPASSPALGSGAIPTSGVAGVIQLPPAYSTAYIHAEPSLSSPVLTSVTDFMPIGIFCTVRGDVVKDPVTGQSSRLWDYIGSDLIPDIVGYIPDIFVYTKASRTTIGSC